MMKANIDAYKLSWEELINYLERLELTMEIEKGEKHNNGNNPNKNKGTKRKSGTDENAADSTKPTASKKTERWCTYCKNSTHNTEKCWFKDKDKQGDQQSGNNRTYNSSGNKNKYKGTKENTYVFTEDQVKVLFANLPSHQTANTTSRKKRRVHYERETSSGSEVDSTSFFAEEQNDARNKRK